uniref:Neuropeptide 38 n=1 Tax=Echinococcus multilocularis TaxID=6211 RepID=A0A1B1M0V5_ECHMU|nr:neuropeptide precursor 38 [Echinococcus multilocularis]
MRPCLLVLIVFIHLAFAMPHQLDLRWHQMEKAWADELQGEPESPSLKSRLQWYPKYQVGTGEPDTLPEILLKRIRRILADY